MPMYLTHFKCEPSAWPTDHEEQVKIWGTMVKDAEQMVKDESAVKFTGWINNTEGYSLLEAESKTEAIGLCAQFWPYFHNEIMELVPTSEAGPAVLAGATKGWQSG